MSTLYEVTPTGTIKATYDVSVEVAGWYPPVEENAKLCFHLTDEGLIVDLFDDDGNCMATFAATAEEFLPFILEG